MYHFVGSLSLYMDSSFLRNLSRKKLHSPSAVGLLLAVMHCTSRNFQQAACKPFVISRLLGFEFTATSQQRKDLLTEKSYAWA